MMRQIVLEDETTVDHPDVAALIDAAIATSPHAFPSTGAHCILIKS